MTPQAKQDILASLSSLHDTALQHAEGKGDSADLYNVTLITAAFIQAMKTDQLNKLSDLETIKRLAIEETTSHEGGHK